MSEKTRSSLPLSALAPTRAALRAPLEFTPLAATLIPPYILGGAVLIPQITIFPLLAAFQTTPLIPFEDVYLSGICSEKTGIKLLFSSRSFRFVFALREMYNQYNIC